MTEARITIRIDAVTKQQLKAFSHSVGLTSSRMIRALIMQALRERKILLLNKDPALSLQAFIAKQGLTEDLD